MPAPAPPRHRGSERLFRAAATVAALALALVALFRQHELARQQDEMARWLEREGVPAPAELVREPDPERVSLRAARAVLDAEIDAAHRGPLDAAARQEGARRLAAAADWAAGVLADRPAAWDAALVRGAATYLAWSAERDPRLFTAAPVWQAPLAAAVELAPHRPEPARFLATVDLELWQVLSPGRREEARRLLAVAFADPPTCAALIGPWLAIARDREEAFAVIPADPEAWRKVEEIYARQHDWPGFCAARARRGDALLAWLTRRLARAEELAAHGGLEAARPIFLEVAAEALPGRRFLDLVRRALLQCPPGPVEKKIAERLTSQLTWALERCLLDRCPLPERALHRLAGFCRGLDPPREAMAALVTGDLPRAEILDHAADRPWSAAWAPYGLLKARVLANAGRTGEAAAALAAVDGDWLAHPAYWRVRADLARAAGEAPAAAAAAQALSRLAARAWPATAWDWRGGVARLELLAAQPAAGLDLRIDVAPAEGAAVEVRLDDATLGTFPAARGATLTLAAPLAVGLHLLEVESVAGGSGGAVLPGPVRLAGEGEGGRAPGEAR
jgi:hypothetical protein